MEQKELERMPTLGRYLSIIFDRKYQDGNPPENRQFRFKENPILHSNRANVILNYRGSFNPPHRGHLAVLWHAYNQLASDLNIIAAAICLRSDDDVKDKYDGDVKKRVLSSEDRARLWKEDANFPPWAWIFEESRDGSYSTLRKKLTALATKDGCNIRYAWLAGPDCCGTHQNEWQFLGMTIVSDVGREADYDQQGGLQMFHKANFGPWLVDDGKKTPAQTKEAMQTEQEIVQKGIQRQLNIVAGEDRARRAVTEKFDPLNMSASLFQGASDLAIAKVDGLLGLDTEQKQPSSTAPLKIEESLVTQLARLGSPLSVSVCWQKYARPRKSLRFLRSTPEQHAPFRFISSSVIQEKMHGLKGYRLKSALESMALSPDLLWEILLPKRLQRDESDDQDIRECAPHLATELGLVTVPAHNSQLLVFYRGTRMIDDMALPMRKDEAPLGAELTQLRKRKRNASDDLETNGRGVQRKILKAYIDRCSVKAIGTLRSLGYTVTVLDELRSLMPVVET